MEVKAWTNRTMPAVMTLLAVMSMMNGPVVGSILNWRQEESTDKSTLTGTTNSAESATSSPSASVTNSASETQTLASGSNSPDRPVLASATSSTIEASSVVSTATTSALNSIATSNSTLSEYNDPSFCHPVYDPGVLPNPFCTPVEGSFVDLNTSYKVTWDASKFQIGENITISLHTVDETANTTIASHATLLDKTVDSALGYTYINTTIVMLNGSTNATLFLFANGTENGEPQQYPGPSFFLLNKAGDSANSSSNSGSSTSKELGEKVGIPVGLIFFLIIIAALAFFLFRYRRNNAGYATGKSLGQRTNTGSLRGSGSSSGGGAAARGSRGHKRQESFHDEPTSGGVELQERTRGLTGEDNWDWGRDSVGSPVSPVSPTGNQFRDELQRQKTAGRR